MPQFAVFDDGRRRRTRHLTVFDDGGMPDLEGPTDEDLLRDVESWAACQRAKLARLEAVSRNPVQNPADGLN